jgi:hypothetical protein
VRTWVTASIPGAPGPGPPKYASSDESQLDPLTAAPDRNRFLKTVVPFLRTVR